MITTSPLRPSAAAIDFVRDDFQDTVWYDGVVPCCPVDDLTECWERFKADSITWGRPVPEDLTPEMYYMLWNEEYHARTSST